jgi:DNA-binding NarL/FixJ family response regulator
MQERVFRYLCQGLSNADIANELGRSEFTVANHAKAVLKAFGVRSRSALIAEAMKRGLL